MATLESLTETVASLRSDIKNLAKLVRKVRNFQEDPTGEKNKKRTENNGFNRKMEVSDKLKSFLDLKAGEYISRSDVTRRINKYIKEKELKHPDNGRVIVMDASLTDLLSPPEDVQVTFLNMQKYISPHYLKAAPVEDVPEDEKVAPAVAPPAPVDDVVAKKTQKRPTVKKATKA
jgi:chromatin remodeling complex protein RSC6